MAVGLNLSSHGEGNGMDPCDKHRGDGERKYADLSISPSRLSFTR